MGSIVGVFLCSSLKFKMMTSPDTFFSFSKFWYSGLLRESVCVWRGGGGGGGLVKAENDQNSV